MLLFIYLFYECFNVFILVFNFRPRFDVLSVGWSVWHGAVTAKIQRRFERVRLQLRSPLWVVQSGECVGELSFVLEKSNLYRLHIKLQSSFCSSKNVQNYSKHSEKSASYILFTDPLFTKFILMELKYDGRKPVWTILRVDEQLARYNR